MWRRILAATVIIINGFAGTAHAQAPVIMIRNISTRHVVARAVDAAIRRVETASCQRVLDEFADVSGRPLRAAIESQNITPGEFLARLRFADGSDTKQCGRINAIAAFTVPGNRVIFICSSAFGVQFPEEIKAAQMIIIHEMLHAAGLGENPPSSRDITARVTKRCGA